MPGYPPRAARRVKYQVSPVPPPPRRARPLALLLPNSWTLPAGIPNAFVRVSVTVLFTLNLPPATGSGNWVVIHRLTGGAANLDVTPNGTDTINGVNAAVNINAIHGVLRLTDVAVGAWLEW